jgi:hypothetical protein
VEHGASKNAVQAGVAAFALTEGSRKPCRAAFALTQGSPKPRRAAFALTQGSSKPCRAAFALTEGSRKPRRARFALTRRDFLCCFLKRQSRGRTKAMRVATNGQ